MSRRRGSKIEKSFFLNRKDYIFRDKIMRNIDFSHFQDLALCTRSCDHILDAAHNYKMSNKNKIINEVDSLLGYKQTCAEIQSR